MMRAYAEEYLDDAMHNLGEAFDYAANACNISLEQFMCLFIASGYSDQFGNGHPKVISGTSGTELVADVFAKTGIEIALPDAQVAYDCSSEFWCGWILAFYQWYTTRSFRDIHDHISMDEILKLYPTLHEAPEEKFIDVVNSIILQKAKNTRLQTCRKKAGLTQIELATRSGVNLRTLQQYELGSKDINKASVQNVMALVRALGCELQDILEYPTDTVNN